MSICDYCQVERCVDDKQCTSDLHKKGIIFSFGKLKLIDKKLSMKQVLEELDKPFME